MKIVLFLFHMLSFFYKTDEKINALYMHLCSRMIYHTPFCLSFMYHQSLLKLEHVAWVEEYYSNIENTTSINRFTKFVIDSMVNFLARNITQTFLTEYCVTERQKRFWYTYTALCMKNSITKKQIISKLGIQYQKETELSDEDKSTFTKAYYSLVRTFFSLGNNQAMGIYREYDHTTLVQASWLFEKNFNAKVYIEGDSVYVSNPKYNMNFHEVVKQMRDI